MYSIICSGYDTAYTNKAKEFILAWTQTYLPTGNPVNEILLEPLFHCYFLIKETFPQHQQEGIENQFVDMALKERENDKLPMDKKEAKRIRIIGTLGYILNDPELVKYAVHAFKKFVEVSLYPDGTSYDLAQHDLLGDHIDMLESLVSFGITFRQFEGPETEFDVYHYESPSGSSVKKSVEYVIPYVEGDKSRLEYTTANLTAESTLADESDGHTNPGEWFHPSVADEVLQLSAFFEENAGRAKGSTNTDSYCWLQLMVDVAAGKIN